MTIGRILADWDARFTEDVHRFTACLSAVKAWDRLVLEQGNQLLQLQQTSRETLEQALATQQLLADIEDMQKMFAQAVNEFDGQTEAVYTAHLTASQPADQQRAAMYEAVISAFDELQAAQVAATRLVRGWNDTVAPRSRHATGSSGGGAPRSVVQHVVGAIDHHLLALADIRQDAAKLEALMCSSPSVFDVGQRR